MAYYNVATNPKRSIKSKSSGGKSFIDLTNFHPSENKTIGDDWDVQPGDVISWGDYRAVDTYFVDERRHLRENDDTSGSGYLTIPLSISRLFPSVLEHYKLLMENEPNLVSSIELPPTDGLFADKFGSSLPESICNRRDISFEFSPVEMVVYVTVGKNEAFPFPIDGTRTKDIVDYIDIANEKKTTVLVNFNIQGEETCREWPGHIKNGLLPVGWTCQQHGTLSGGQDHWQGAWKLQGPEKSKEIAKQVVKKLYDGFNVTIS